MLNPGRMIMSLQQNIGKAIVGKEEAVEYALIALLCKGHVLIEDVPGVGKTTLASALARSLDCTFRRIQFTPDLMPSDVTGYTLINIKTGEMEYREGAVMSQIVLADEINRTSPKTQSALLEVMEEHQVTVDGKPTRCRGRLLCLPPRTPENLSELIRCRKPRLTGSSCVYPSDTRLSSRKWMSWSAIPEAFRQWQRLNLSAAPRM